MPASRKHTSHRRRDAQVPTLASKYTGSPRKGNTSFHQLFSDLRCFPQKFSSGATFQELPAPFPKSYQATGHKSQQETAGERFLLPKEAPFNYIPESGAEEENSPNVPMSVYSGIFRRILFHSSRTEPHALHAEGPRFVASVPKSVVFSTSMGNGKT